jgi:hypothetical protein
MKNIVLKYKSKLIFRESPMIYISKFIVDLFINLNYFHTMFSGSYILHIFIINLHEILSYEYEHGNFLKIICPAIPT